MARIAYVLAASIGAFVCMAGTPAFPKSARQCRADYAADKKAVKASGQTRKAYLAACRATPADAAAQPPAAPAATPPADPMAPKPLMTPAEAAPVKQ